MEQFLAILALFGRPETAKSHHSSNIRIHFGFFLCHLLLLSSKKNQTVFNQVSHTLDTINNTIGDEPYTNLLLFLFFSPLTLPFFLFLLLFQDSLIKIYDKKRDYEHQVLNCLLVFYQNGSRWNALQLMSKLRLLLEIIVFVKCPAEKRKRT